MSDPTGQKKSKIQTTQDVLRGNLQGAAYAAARINKGVRGGGGKKKGKAKKKLVVPPVGGWKGGHSDNNGLKLTETYGSEGKMRRSECSNRSKI